MDLETENRIAAMLLKEAAELRRQAEREGVHAYLRKPQVRGRPNSRFLSATVLGVQQANKAVEVNEMWRVRKKELELDDKINRRLSGRSSHSRINRDVSELRNRTGKSHADEETDASAPCSSSKSRNQESYEREGESLRDDEVEEFLNSRIKRGRGAVGSRMDETGPYLLSCPEGKQLASPELRHGDEWERVVFGPEKPSFLKSYESSDDESPKDKKEKKTDKSKKHSRKHKSEEEGIRKKKRRKEKERRRHYK